LEFAEKRKSLKQPVFNQSGFLISEMTNCMLYILMQNPVPHTSAIQAKVLKKNQACF
jgi:hypothetical protein